MQRRKKSMGYKPSFETLENRQLMAVVVAETENNNWKGTADVVQLTTADQSARVTGRISSERDQDFFRLAGAKAGPVSISITSGAGLVGRVSVEDTAGNKLFESEPNDGVNAGRFNVAANQTVFLRVRGTSKGSAGNYTVRINLQNGGGTGGGEPVNLLRELEPNNIKAQATVANLGSDNFQRLTGTSQSDDDRDFFVLTPTKSGRLNLHLSYEGQPIKLEIENAAGLELGEIETNDGVFSGSIQVQAGQKYFLRLRSAEDTRSTYFVDLALTPQS
jgi:hypothetical protein